MGVPSDPFQSSPLARFLRWLEWRFPEVFVAFRNATTEAHSSPTKTTDDLAREILFNSASPKEGLPGSPRGAASEVEHTPAQEEVFLRQMRDQTARRDNELDREADSLRMMERSLFKVELFLAMVTFCVAVAGVWLAMGERATLSVVAGGIGLLTGGGTVGLNRKVKELGLRRDVNGRIREDNIRTLQAIQGALLVTNRQERDAEIRMLAAWLRDRAMRKPT